MLIGNRQAKYGAANVPPIDFSEKIDIAGYETIRDIFTEAILKKMGLNVPERTGDVDEKMKKHYAESEARERNIFKTSIEQTINFLKHIEAMA